MKLHTLLDLKTDIPVFIHISDGKMHDVNALDIFITPSMGQDEEGGVNQKDYLCALTSAEYCFRKAIEYKLDTDGYCL